MQQEFFATGVLLPLAIGLTMFLLLSGVDSCIQTPMMEETTVPFTPMTLATTAPGCTCSASSVSTTPRAGNVAATTTLVNSGGGVCSLTVTCTETGLHLEANEGTVTLAPTPPAREQTVQQSPATATLNCVNGAFTSDASSVPASEAVTQVDC